MGRIQHGEEMHRDGGGVVYSAVPADTAVNSLTDVTIVSTTLPAVAGDQLVVEAAFTINNNSGATRIYNISLDFDGQFAGELITGGLGTNATGSHPFYLRGVLDIRSTSLAYAIVELDGNTNSSSLPNSDFALSTGTNAGKTWGDAAADLTGVVTVELLIRSASATSTQTFRLHNFTIRRVSA